MIYIYMGKIGDGKTYHVVVNEIVPAVRRGRRVYHNIDGLGEGMAMRRLMEKTDKAEHEIKLTKIESKDEWRELLQLDLDDKEGKSLRLERDSLVVVDEAQMIYDSRDFKNTTKTFLTLLEYHRHFGLDFVFITQNVTRLEKAIRGLTNECYQVKNLSFLSGVLGYRYVKHVRQTPDSDITTTQHGKLDPENFALYRSAVQHSRFKRGGGTYFSTPILAVGAAVFCLVVYGAFKRNPFMGGKPKAHAENIPSSAVAVVPAPNIQLDFKDALNSGSLTEGTTSLQLIEARSSLASAPSLGCTMKKVPWSYRIVYQGVEQSDRGVREEAVCY